MPKQMQFRWYDTVYPLPWWDACDDRPQFGPSERLSEPSMDDLRVYSGILMTTSICTFETLLVSPTINAVMVILLGINLAAQVCARECSRGVVDTASLLDIRRCSPRASRRYMNAGAKSTGVASFFRLT